MRIITTIYFVCATLSLGSGLIAIKAEMPYSLVFMVMGWCGFCLAQGLCALGKVNHEIS